MDERIKDVKNVLLKTMEGIKKQDAQLIKDWSDHIIHNASIYQDEFLTRTAVITYALSKMLERTICDFNKKTCQNFWEKIERNIKKIIEELENEDISKINHYYTKIIEIIKQYDSNYGEYVGEVLEKARIKKAWKVYTHGLSMGRVAELLGVSQWELMNYLGVTKANEEYTGGNASERYKKFKKYTEK